MELYPSATHIFNAPLRLTTNQAITIRTTYISAHQPKSGSVFHTIVTKITKGVTQYTSTCLILISQMLMGTRFSIEEGEEIS